MTTAPEITSIRNVVFVSHGGGGKTTLIEAMLYNAKAIKKMGSTAKGDAVMVTEPEEIERKMTITPHIAFCNWKNSLINLIDTPGHINFLENARSVMPVADGAVFLLSADLGLRPETARLWQMSKDFMLPGMVLINDMDSEQADFDKTLEQLEEAFEVPCIPLTIPLSKGPGFKGYVDILGLTAVEDKDGAGQSASLPNDLAERAKEIKTRLVEQVAEADDSLLEKYLEGTELTEQEVKHGLKKAVLHRQIVPVFCGSAVSNCGVKILTDALVDLFPNPVEIGEVRPLVGSLPNKPGEKVERKISLDQPFSAFVFKTSIDPFSGKLSYIRVFSGSQVSDQNIYNGTRDEKDKAGHMYKLQGKEMIQIPSLTAGDIGAIAKMTNVRTGDTLCDAANPMQYQQAKLVEPVLNFAVEADAKTEEKAAAGLFKLCEEDVTMKFFRDAQTHEMILAGMGQTHLEVTLERLSRKFGAKVTLKTQKVPYRETVRKQVRVQGKYKKQTGGHGQYGDCTLVISPLGRDGGFEFLNKIVGGVIPRNYIPSVEKGVVEAMQKGILGGFPVVDIRVELVDGSYHAVDSSDYAFKVAGSMAFKKAMEQAEPVLLEPVMSLEIIVPEETMGNVIKDLNSRRGKVLGMDPQGANQLIKADVPMDEVLEYGNVLHALTSGRGIYTMSISTYEATPAPVAKKIQERYAATKSGTTEEP